MTEISSLIVTLNNQFTSPHGNLLINTYKPLCNILYIYLLCLNACQWRYGLQTYFRTFTRASILFNHLIDGYCHSLFICYTLITYYYHNITQLDAKCLHLTRYMTLIWYANISFTQYIECWKLFSLICILKAKSSLSLLVFYVICNDILVIYVTAQMCTPMGTFGG